jgi:site-specific recombinase XerD
MTRVCDFLSQQWLDHAAAEGQSENTLRRRRAVLASVGNAGTATREQVEAWWATRRDRSPATRTNDLACLRSFYRWCIRWGHRTDDPTLRLDPPPVPNTLPRPMGRADLRRLLANLPADLRRAVALGAYAGLRVSEAATLDWSSLNQETRRIYIRGKGRKERVVGLSMTLLDELLPDTGGNVVAAGGKPYTPDTLQRKVNRAIKRAGVDGTYHTLRHRYGTVAYEATGDLLAVSRAMGHSSTKTTEVYTAMSDDALDRIAAAVVH